MNFPLDITLYPDENYFTSVSDILDDNAAIQSLWFLELSVFNIEISPANLSHNRFDNSIFGKII